MTNGILSNIASTLAEQSVQKTR